MRRKLLTAAEAKVLLEPHAKDFAACLDYGWQQWRQFLRDHPARAAVLRPGTRAGMVYDWTVEEAHRRFDGRDGVRLTVDHNFLALVVEETAVLRFKKFRGVSLRTSGIPTQARVEYLGQGHFDGMAMTNLVVGYRLDSLEMELAQLAITCPQGDNRNSWVLDLDGEAGGSGQETPLPISPAGSADDGPRIISARPAAKSQEE